ncbi:MAG: S16 family serine protease [Candidatus Bathyarchaeia archaeon]
MSSGKVVAALLIVLCLSVSLNFVLYMRVSEYESWLKSLHEKVNELSLENFMLKESLEVLKREVEYYQINVSLTGDNWIHIAGVVTSSSGSYEGEILRVYARFIEGTGKVFIATSPKIGIELQSSAETAFKVAQEISNVYAGKFDCMLTVVADRSIDVVDGPSAGSAITILLSLILLREEPRRDVIITGTIQSDGTIGKVGGIIEKAIAAAKTGVTMLLVPKGQSKVTIYVEEITRIGPFKIIRYKPEVVNVQEYLGTQGYTIQIIEVSNILEALEYFKV